MGTLRAPEKGRARWQQPFYLFRRCRNLFKFAGLEKYSNVSEYFPKTALLKAHKPKGLSQKKSNIESGLRKILQR